MEKYTFPVLSQSPLHDSPSNFLFEPLPYYSKDHWKNKNRHPWTREQITENIIKECGQDMVRPTRYSLLLKRFEVPEKTKGGIILSDKDRDSIQMNWSIGKVLDIGPCAFDHQKFPEGASATYNDWVVFGLYEKQSLKVKNLEYVNIQDFSVLDVIKDPYEITQLEHLKEIA